MFVQDLFVCLYLMGVSKVKHSVEKVSGSFIFLSRSVVNSLGRLGTTELEVTIQHPGDEFSVFL